ncbi:MULTISPECIES: hypothetical protein [unclassified Cyanobium]|uniref:hypothetical protein n=1 Tax=unclassified Cyanobium TaxID=2627006 RepID=UPI0020CF33EA|nr:MULTISPECIES: hypothetical protein [unclassified Cyanobium]MCP9779033.1 hypothetical protein [Cyanobium sp. Tous-M-B4]MCP9877163.1 hypothetical protein [Cyanobium sp. A2C-AMD]
MIVDLQVIKDNDAALIIGGAVPANVLEDNCRVLGAEGSQKGLVNCRKNGAEGGLKIGLDSFDHGGFDH